MFLNKVPRLLPALLLGALPAFSADYTAWASKKIITLNTAAAGANVAGTVTNFPVLIRLGSAESAILAGGGANGSGIRFSKADNTTALPYQIESWSSTAAAIWVKVDSVKGNNATQTIVLHYGNPGTVASESNGPAVFDTANGFRGVWHLHDSTGAKSTDATVFNTNATWYNSPVLTDGLIGKAVNFNQGPDVAPETAKHLRAPYNVANDNFKATSANGITLSAWVKRNANSNGAEQGILGRYNWGANARQAMIALNGSDQIRLFRSTNGTNSGGAETNFGTQTIVDGAWTYIAATLKNGSQILYVNGVQDVAQTTANIGSLDSIWATKTSDLAFARMAPDHSANPVHQSFDGVIDEARYTAVARSADWIKLEFENQKLMNSLTGVGLPVAPGAPTGVTGVAGNTQVTLTWVAPASNGGAPVTLYKAYAVGDTAKACTTTGALTCAVTGLVNGTGYTFAVKATNAAGTALASAATGTITPAAQVPGAPTGVTAVNATGGIAVSWFAPADNGSAITSYKAMAVSDTAKSCTPNGTTLTCTVTGLTAGTTYTFQVRAINAVGASARSAASSSVTGIVGPGSLVFSVGNFSKAYTFVLPENAASLTENLTLAISDVTGKTVWSKTVKPAGSEVREIAWNGLTSKGSRVSAGMYVARVKMTNAAGTQEVAQTGVKLRD